MGGDEEITEKEDVLIGTNIEIESDCSTEQFTGIPPKYTLQPVQLLWMSYDHRYI